MTVLRRLFRYLAPYWKQLILTAILLILLTVLELLPPLFQKQIIDEVIGTRDLNRLGVLIAGLVGVYALSVLGLTVQPAKLQLRLAVSGASRLTQQLQADPAVTLAIALATQQATKATLCFDHTFARRLFEQPTGNPLDPLLAAQPLAVEQPKRHTQRQTRRGSGRDLTSGNRSTRSHAHQGLDGSGRALYSFFDRVKVLSKAKKLDPYHTP